MKKKLLAILLCIAMLAIAIVGGTMAYFTDAETQTNTFTVGKVAITLDEAKLVMDDNNKIVYDANGNPTYNDRTSAPQTYQLVPGMEFKKDPTITLTSGSENAYIAAIVTVKFDAPEGKTADEVVALMTQMGLHHPGHPMLNVGGFLTGTYINPTDLTEISGHPLNNKNNAKYYANDVYSVYQIGDDKGLTYTIYMFFEGAKTAGTQIALFDTIKAPAVWGNDEMAVLDGMSIQVDAYAVQAHGIQGIPELDGKYACYNAMVAGFGQNSGDPFKLT